MAGNSEGSTDARAFNAREIERRNRESSGKPLSPVMKAAATACEVAHGAGARKPKRR